VRKKDDTAESDPSKMGCGYGLAGSYGADNELPVQIKDRKISLNYFFQKRLNPQKRMD
jgi:hypothetical protein